MIKLKNKYNIGIITCDRSNKKNLQNKFSKNYLSYTIDSLMLNGSINYIENFGNITIYDAGNRDDLSITSKYILDVINKYNSIKVFVPQKDYIIKMNSFIREPINNEIIEFSLKDKNFIKLILENIKSIEEKEINEIIENKNDKTKFDNFCKKIFLEKKILNEYFAVSENVNTIIDEKQYNKISFDGLNIVTNSITAFNDNNKKCDYFIYMQDDVVVCRNFIFEIDSYIERNKKELNDFSLISFYTPLHCRNYSNKNTKIKNTNELHEYIPDYTFFFSSLCWVFNSNFIQNIIDEFNYGTWKCANGFDIFIPRVIKKYDKKAWYHDPCLAQHIGEYSTLSDRNGKEKTDNFIGINNDATNNKYNIITKTPQYLIDIIYKECENPCIL